jgi:hypothetical protein
MVVFTRPNGQRVAIAGFNVHRVLSTADPNCCDVVYSSNVVRNIEDGIEQTESTMAVVGTFDAVMAAVEDRK